MISPRERRLVPTADVKAGDEIAWPQVSGLIGAITAVTRDGEHIVLWTTVERHGRRYPISVRRKSGGKSTIYVRKAGEIS